MFACYFKVGYKNWLFLVIYQINKQLRKILKIKKMYNVEYKYYYL